MKTPFFRRLLVLALFSVGCLSPDASAYTSGQFLTGSNTSNNNYPATVVGPGGVFYGAWKEVNAIKIATFNGTNWVEVPTASFTGAQVSAALGDAELDGISDMTHRALAVQSNGDIHIVYHAGAVVPSTATRRGVIYGKYTATTQTWAFRKLFIVSDPGGNQTVLARTACLVLDASNNPHVVFARFSNAGLGNFYTLNYAFFNGTVWNVSGTTNAMDSIQLDAGTVASQNIGSTDLTIDGSGNLHCSYFKDTATNQPDIWYVKRTGTTWGTPVLAADVNDNFSTSIAVSPTGVVSIVDRTQSGPTVTFRLTTDATGSFVTSTIATYTFPGATTIDVADVIIRQNSAGRRVIGAPMKGQTDIGTEFHLLYETAPGVWAQESALTDVGTLTVSLPALAVRDTDNMVMALFSRVVTTPDSRNLYFTTGVPTGYTGGGPVAVAPTVTTATQSAVTHNSATLGGNVTADGGASVTERGIVWGLALNPTTTADTKVPNGSGTGAFSATVNGLPSNTTIHVRAYATNSVDTSYGADISFTTLPTVAVVSLSRTSATPTNLANLTWQITFAQTVTGLQTSNFALVNGGLTSPSITSVNNPNFPAASTTWNITCSTGTGDGTLGLNLANATGLSAAVSTSLPFVGQVYTVDKSPPTVQSVTRLAPAGQNTNATTVTFRVTYSELVTLTAPLTTHFQVVPVNGSTITGTVQSVTGSDGTATRDVTVQITGGTGEFRLRVLD